MNDILLSRQGVHLSWLSPSHGCCVQERDCQGEQISALKAEHASAMMAARAEEEVRAIARHITWHALKTATKGEEEEARAAALQAVETAKADALATAVAVAVRAEEEEARAAAHELVGTAVANVIRTRLDEEERLATRQKKKYRHAASKYT